MSYEDRPGMPSYDLLLGENTAMLVEINRLEAESATKDEVIRRLFHMARISVVERDGERRYFTFAGSLMSWPDAHRAVLESL